MLKSIIIFAFLSLTFQVDQNIDYLKETQKWVDRVYKQIYGVGCKHTHTPATRFEQIKTKKQINCAASASITYQEAGLIDKGKLVSHTSAVHKNIISHYDVSDLKKSLQLSISNYHNLKAGTCDLVKVMKKYHDLPSWLQKKGIMYIQDSNICISAGEKKIYSCNSSDRTYSPSDVNPLRSSGYPFTSPILWAVVPRTNGKSNVDQTTSLKHISC